MNLFKLAILLALPCCAVLSAQPGQVKAPLVTPFAKEVNPKAPLQEYPRPQLQRDGWMNLNGEWDYTIDSSGFTPVKGFSPNDSYTTASIPEKWSGKIVVPYAIETSLSGVGHILMPEERLWYQREFTIPKNWDGKRVVIHFQASDWETSLYVNGKRVGQHRGGYDPFSFDITDYLKAGKNTLNVAVWDATEGQCQTHGKQTLVPVENRKGFRYLPTGGIWQTVWVEALPKNAIENVKITPQYDSGAVLIKATTTKPNSRVIAQIKSGKKVVATAQIAAEGTSIPLKNFVSWSPDSPSLYDVELTIDNNGVTEDKVTSYFGMRKIEVKKDAAGVPRIFLNNKEIFQYGPLDQGYWPDGGLTPPSEQAILFDLEYLKSINSNMVRVHIKTHPERWYYHADRLGLLIWQDGVSMYESQTIDDKASKQWQAEFKSMIDWLYNHPCIINWVVFNEEWGQHDTERITNWVKSYDPSRLVTGASGYKDFPCGDIKDMHDYTFYPKSTPDHLTNRQRAAVIGECAGMNVPVTGHTWYNKNNPARNPKHDNFTPVSDYDFSVEVQRHTYPDSKTYTEAYGRLVETLRWHNAINGCNGVVYTQLTDIEHELNGWLTYDREVSKIPVEKMRQMNTKMYKRMEIVPLIDWSQKWTDADNVTTQLPITQTKEQKQANKPKMSSYHITNYFDVKDTNSDYCISTYGLNNCEIYINGVRFRKTAGNFSALTEATYDSYAISGDDLKLLKVGKNKIELKFDQRGGDTHFDVALFKEKR